MSNAIPTNTHAVNGPNGASAGASADWLSRLGGNPGQDNSGATSFARWMAQHSPQAPVPAQPQATSTATPPPARPAPPPSAAAQSNKAMSPRTVAQAKAPDTPSPVAAASGRAAQVQTQAQAQARADAAKVARQAQTERTQQADANRQAKGAQGAAKPEQAKGAGGAGSVEGSQNTEATRGSEDPDDTRFATAQGEGAALVRELTPPPTVQAGDPASMMAWLASLTQAGAEPGAAESATPGGDGLADAGEANRGLGRDGAVGRDGRAVASGLGWRGRESGQEAGAGKGGAAGDASLQADALLGRGREALALQDEGLGKGGIDVSALLAADGGRVASFGQSLSAAKEALPHARATLPTPLDAPEFAQKLADQVSLWVGQSRSDGPMTAELHLNPVEMGPIHVKISLDGQSAQVDFAAAALETRQAIEASLSALSSSLEDAGLSLSGGNVFSQTPQQQQEARQRFGSDPARAGQRSGGANGPLGEVEAVGLRQVSAPRSSRLGGLDLYA